MITKCATVRVLLVAALLPAYFVTILQVSDVAMEFVKQNIFVASGRSDEMKVVQDDPGTKPI